MKKKCPVIFADEDLYTADAHEVELVLNLRKIFDYGCGVRFDERVIAKLGLHVGVLLHTTDVMVSDDSVLERFFYGLRAREYDQMYAVPTRYEHAKNNRDAMEICQFEPSLVGKIGANFQSFGLLRGSQVGLFSGAMYLFSASADFGLLDVDGEYTLIFGEEAFVDEIVGSRSWDTLDKTNVDSRVISILAEARVAYGYV